MQLPSIQNSIALIVSLLLVNKSQAVTIPLPPANSNPIFNYFTNFDWINSTGPTNHTFSVDVPEPSRVHVTDLNYKGKGFSVYDNDKLLGETATVITKDNPFGINEYNYRQCFFNVDSGRHLITVQLNDPAEKGVGTIRMIPGWNKTEVVIVPTFNIENNSTTILNNTVTENPDQTFITGIGITENDEQENEQPDDEGEDDNEDSEDEEEDGEDDEEDGEDDEEDEYDEDEEDDEEEDDFDGEENGNSVDNNEENEQFNDKENGDKTDETENSDEVVEGNVDEDNTEAKNEHCIKDDESNDSNLSGVTSCDYKEYVKQVDDCEKDLEINEPAVPSNETEEEPYTVTITSTINVNVYGSETSGSVQSTPF